MHVRSRSVDATWTTKTTRLSVWIACAALTTGCLSPVQDSELPDVQFKTLNSTRSIPLGEMAADVAVIKVFSFH